MSELSRAQNNQKSLFSYGIVYWFFAEKRLVVAESLDLIRISRTEMGAYLCIAQNGIPPSISKRIILNVECKCHILYLRKLILDTHQTYSNLVKLYAFFSFQFPLWSGFLINLWERLWEPMFNLSVIRSQAQRPLPIGYSGNCCWS